MQRIGNPIYIGLDSLMYLTRGALSSDGMDLALARQVPQ